MWLDALFRVLPLLIVLAEKLLGPKTGDQKKELVLGAAQLAMEAVGAVSTGGQAETWDRIKPSVGKIVDAGVEIIFPKGTSADPQGGY